MFLTTASSCPNTAPTAASHRAHHAAQARGQTRLAEMNQQVLGNLDRIIDTLDNDDDRRADEDSNAG